MKRGGSRQTLRSCSSCCASIDRDTVAATGAESDREGQTFVAAFREGLQKLGWAEGRNIRIDYRWTGLDKELIQRFTKELLALQPDLILTQSTPATAELLRQTRTIPIVFALVADPIGSGFVASFPQPGGNITGFVTMEPTMAAKWLELLKEIAPRTARVVMLFNPVTAPYAEYWLNPFKDAAASFAVQALLHLFTTHPSLNPSLPHKHRSRMAA